MNKFWQLQKGDFFRFNKNVQLVSHKLDRGSFWAEEPICSMRVTDIDKSKEYIILHFECVNNCGCHIIEDLDESEAKQACGLLGEDLISLLSFNDIVEAAEAAIKGAMVYDIEGEIKVIEEIISR